MLIGISSCYSSINLPVRTITKETTCIDNAILEKLGPIPSNIEIKEGNVISADDEAAKWIVDYSHLRKQIKLWLSNP